jgi:hypothetical protein
MPILKAVQQRLINKGMVLDESKDRGIQLMEFLNHEFKKLLKGDQISENFAKHSAQPLFNPVNVISKLAVHPKGPAWFRGI